MKKLIVAALAVFGIALSALSQEIKIHTVKKGETLSSIAELYGVTKEQIIELNPDAADFIYSGLSLKIPVSVEPSVAPQTPVAPAAEEPVPPAVPTETPTTPVQPEKAVSTPQQAVVTPQQQSASPASGSAKKEKRHGIALVHVGYSYLGISHDSESANLDGVAAGFTWGTQLTNGGLMFCADASYCYNYANDKAYFFDSKISLSSLKITPMIGYRIAIGDSMALMPYTGPSYVLNLSGSCTYGNLEFDPFDSDLPDPWSKNLFSWGVGAHFSFKGFTAGVDYGLFLSTLYDGASQSSFTASLGYSF